jgi:hypothetical protein
MFQPGFTRGILGLIIGMIIGAALISLIRLVMGEPFSSGSVVFFAAFGGLFGWLWGIGSFHKYSHDHHGIEHARAENAPNPLSLTAGRVRQAMPGIMASVRPLIQPLLIASAVALVIVAIFFIGGAIFGREQTYNQVADAKNLTAALPLTEQLKVNKTLLFAIIVLVIMTIMGGLALGLALLMNSLSQQVEVAKKAAANPPKTEPTAFRLIDFFVSWIADILEGTKHSMNR